LRDESRSHRGNNHTIRSKERPGRSTTKSNMSGEISEKIETTPPARGGTGVLCKKRTRREVTGESWTLVSEWSHEVACEEKSAEPPGV